jgi:hypothetical protein
VRRSRLLHFLPLPLVNAVPSVSSSFTNHKKQLLRFGHLWPVAAPPCPFRPQDFNLRPIKPKPWPSCVPAATSSCALPCSATPLLLIQNKAPTAGCSSDSLPPPSLGESRRHREDPDAMPRAANPFTRRRTNEAPPWLEDGPMLTCGQPAPPSTPTHKRHNILAGDESSLSTSSQGRPASWWPCSSCRRCGARQRACWASQSRRIVRCCFCRRATAGARSPWRW